MIVRNYFFLTKKSALSKYKCVTTYLLWRDIHKKLGVFTMDMLPNRRLIRNGGFVRPILSTLNISRIG